MEISNIRVYMLCNISAIDSCMKICPKSKRSRILHRLRQCWSHISSSYRYVHLDSEREKREAERGWKERIIVPLLLLVLVIARRFMPADS